MYPSSTTFFPLPNDARTLFVPVAVVTIHSVALKRKVRRLGKQIVPAIVSEQLPLSVTIKLVHQNEPALADVRSVRLYPPGTHLAVTKGGNGTLTDNPEPVLTLVKFGKT